MFSKTSFLIFLLIFLSFFQLVYGFLFPAVGLNDSWQKVETYLPKFTVQTQDNGLLAKFLPLISSEYRLNSDVSHYLEMGRYFNAEISKNSPVLSRPLYSFLIYLTTLPARPFLGSSFGITFAAAILDNFILLALGASLFFLLLKKVFSLKVAFLSSVLLVFSPFVHTALSQPRADMFAVFAVISIAYLLEKYNSSPSKLKLVLFSLIVGLLLLGKMFFAATFFILLLAVYFKRYKEGVVFFAVHLIPIGLWYLWVTGVWQIPFYVHEVNYYQGDSLLYIFSWPWHKVYSMFLSALPNFIEVLIYGFLLVPVIFSIIGFKSLPFKSRSIIYFGSILSVFVFGFLANIYYYRIAFLLFPVIYPTCVLGIEKIVRRPFLQAVIIGSIIFISSLNFYKIFNYL